MKHLRRLVWSEGMHLGPHHFQTQSRYFEDLIHFAASALWSNSFGVAGFAIDQEALRNGIVALIHARGILPDGLAFHMPDCDALPPPLPIAEIFPPTRDSLVVSLAIQSLKPNGMNCATPGDAAPGETRLVAEPQIVFDETTGRDERAVDLGCKQFHLLLGAEDSPELVTLPLARIRRSGAGYFVYDENFIPPCLTIGASEHLMMLLKRLIEILEDKSTTLSGRAGRSWSDYSTGDIANFWLLHTVNSSLAPLRDIFSARRAQPEDLFGHMLKLGGALCTFALDSHPRDLPLYNHLDLETCFSQLDQHIRRHLETVAPTNVVSIPLERISEFYWAGNVTDQRCLDRARWILSMRSSLGEVDIMTRTPALVKICSKLFVPKLVERAIPGMPLTHIPVPPSSLGTRVDAQYFSVSRSGKCWEHIVQTREVGVYVPGDIPNADMELLVVLES